MAERHVVGRGPQIQPLLPGDLEQQAIDHAKWEAKVQAKADAEAAELAKTPEQRKESKIEAMLAREGLTLDDLKAALVEK